jgi:hypothetical protein
MKLPRRGFLHLAACAALPAGSRIAWSQAYPMRPVRVVVGLPPGAAQFGVFVEAETEKWAKVVEFSGARQE